MLLQSLGYVGVAASSLDPWASFATKLLGMQLSERGEHSLALRVDHRERRLVIDTSLPAGRHFFGWEAADAAGLQELGARLDAQDVPVKAESCAVAEQRGVHSLISFSDPAGHRVEVFHGAYAAATPFAPSRSLSGFRTGTLGLGHVVLCVADTEPMLRFYRDVLGFRVSDYMLRPFRAHFLHLNARHHSLAFIETGANAFHHLMLELLSLDDVGQAYDLALTEEDRIGVTLGRHSNDFMTSFYARTPSEFLIEYGWGGREIDVQSWEPSEFFHGASLWGHERYWLPADQRREALKLRLKAAADGFRAPVHVLDGFFTRMTSR